MYGFESVDWKKNWDGQWSLLSAYYLGNQYVRQIEDILGVSLQRSLFITEHGSTSCFFSDISKRLFGEALAHRAEKDPEILTGWCQKLREVTDTALSALTRLEDEEPSWSVFSEYMEALYAYGVYHRIVKVVVDYLEPDILKRYLSEFESARVYAEPVYAESEVFIRRFAEKLAVKLGIEARHILAMTYEQFETSLEKGEIPDRSVLEEQDDFALLFMGKEVTVYIFGDEAKVFRQRMFEDVGSDIFRGMSAYGGKAVGHVRIISDPNRNSDFDEGDILVTGMTRPEYLSYIRKSAAFVTDAGGLLSHAAITARELRKPCIIGVENASILLHDGDMVEVDADQGVVRVLERAEKAE